jgi:hypothetical protein
VFVAGGVAGVAVGGLGSRIAMRIAALTARDVAQGLTTEVEGWIEAEVARLGCASPEPAAATR